MAISRAAAVIVFKHIPHIWVEFDDALMTLAVAGVIDPGRPRRDRLPRELLPQIPMHCFYWLAQWQSSPASRA